MKRYLWLAASVLLVLAGLYMILKPTVIDHMIINPAVVEEATAGMDEVSAEDIAGNIERIQNVDVSEETASEDASVDVSGETVSEDASAYTVNAATYETAENSEGHTYPVSNDPNVTYDASVVDSVGEIPADAALNTDYMVGEIYMPGVDMHVPILEGVSNENLWLGAGTMKPGQKMGQGNYALAGHHMWDASQLFTPIMEASKGDAVYITDKTHVYEYRVTNMFVAKQSDGHLVNDVPGHDMVTLVTCTDVWGTERYIVVGELAGQMEIGNAPEDVQRTFGVQ